MKENRVFRNVVGEIMYHPVFYALFFKVLQELRKSIFLMVHSFLPGKIEIATFIILAFGDFSLVYFFEAAPNLQTSVDKITISRWTTLLL